MSGETDAVVVAAEIAKAVKAAKAANAAAMTAKAAATIAKAEALGAEMAVARIQSTLFLADTSRARLPGEPGYTEPEEGPDNEPAGEPAAEDDDGDDNNDAELTDVDALPDSRGFVGFPFRCDCSRVLLESRLELSGRSGRLRSPGHYSPGILLSEV
jgi:hypothetical protein